MRAKLHLRIASFVLISTLLLCGELAPQAYGQQVNEIITTAPPEFIEDMWMELHSRPSMIADMVQPLPGTALSLMPVTKAPVQRKSSLELINYLLKKNSVPTSTVTAATEQTTETPAVVQTPPLGIENKESASTEALEISLAASDEALDPFDNEVDPLINKYAEMISVEPEDIYNYPLYKFIDDWYGTRYRWGGKTKKGIDCSAFSQKLYSEIYGTDILRTCKLQHRHCTRIKHFEDATEGDLVFFKIRRFRVSHVGVYLANGYFVHASRSHGIVISSLENRYWHRRYAGCGRIATINKPVSESNFVQ